MVFVKFFGRGPITDFGAWPSCLRDCHCLYNCTLYTCGI